ncbi:hypothetical protein SBRY_50412 [Actinacidiphila bryophytorum]|uniref:Uncharacterized protein n=1 Tax=Actinacidiphila bryophytorum TaxID=1436133 RepID=A0A9W4MJB0_9ACTN|nr:hypothetical protein SBRY_50412 [Actinacidiphila bryophytorum]
MASDSPMADSSRPFVTGRLPGNHAAVGVRNCGLSVSAGRKFIRPSDAHVCFLPLWSSGTDDTSESGGESKSVIRAMSDDAYGACRSAH